MKTIRELLDAAKAARNVTSDYALAKELQINKARISAYYAGKEAPNEFACLQIAKAIGKSYDEVSAIVRIEAEKDETRRQMWREYYKSIGGIAASFVMVFLFAVTLIVTTTTDAHANSTGYGIDSSHVINYATFRARLRRRVLAVLHRLANAFPRVGLSC